MIISLENFCNEEQQLILSQYIKEILKDIYTLNINKLPDKYPSPKDLVGKFIIKEYKDFNLLRKSSLILYFFRIELLFSHNYFMLIVFPL